MTDLLIDTHVFAWSLVDPDRIAPVARDLLERGGSVFLPPCCLHEIAMKVRKGRWDAMVPHVGSLDFLAVQQGFRIAPFTGAMAMLAGSIEWDHPDPFDRMIAATAIEMGLPLLSADRAFDGLDASQSWPGRVWDPT